MGKIFYFLLFVFCGMLTLNAQEYLDCVRKVKAYLDIKYASGWPLYATEEQKLLDIASSDKSRKEKAAEIRKTFPKAFELSEAEKKYLVSAMAGDAAAQYELGNCYFEGKDGCKKDYKQAVNWFRKSAEQGNPLAQCNLGWCYETGNGVTKDYNQAVDWYRKSAEQGEAVAQRNLGMCYEYGYGVEKDYNQAVNWYRKSAEQGHADAQCSLGVCYYYGQGVSKDYYLAFSYFKRAAESGHMWAQHNVAFCYENGYGVYKDRYTAVSWYRKAAAQGYENSKKALRDMGYSY